MTFGRPPAIPDNYVQLDLPTVDSITEGQPFVDDETIRHSIQFFNQTMLVNPASPPIQLPASLTVTRTLYKHMGNIIDEIYGRNLGCEPGLSVGEMVGRVLSIENQLFSWVMALPDSLRQLTLQGLREEIEKSETQPRLFPLKFQVILTLRYLHIQVLLHRPLLVKFFDASIASGLEPGQERILNEIGYSSTKKCVESAMGIIDMIHELVSAAGWQRDLLGAWWYSLYYSKLLFLHFYLGLRVSHPFFSGEIAFNAALVIIGATWVQRARQSAPDFPMHQTADIRLYPGRAVATLRLLDMGNRMVDRCKYYLEQLISVLRLQRMVFFTPLGLDAAN
jgi:hypothetical protein